MTAARQTGFTLTELMVGLAIVAVVAAIAAPNFRTMSQNSRISATTNEFVGQLNRARSEAISRNVPVILCRSNNVNTTTPTDSTCGGSNETWTTGWLIYTNPGYSGSGGGANYAKATDELLAFHQAVENVEIKSDSDGNRWLALNADGSLSENGAARYGICDERSTAAGKLVEISMTGRVSVVDTTTAADSDCNP